VYIFGVGNVPSNNGIYKAQQAIDQENDPQLVCQGTHES